MTIQCLHVTCPDRWHVHAISGYWVCFVFVYAGSISVEPIDVVKLGLEGGGGKDWKQKQIKEPIIFDVIPSDFSKGAVKKDRLSLDSCWPLF